MSDEAKHTVKIVSFNPLELTLPDDPGPYTETVWIELPPVKVTVREFFGPGWRFADRDNMAIKGELPCVGFNLTVGEGSSVTAGELVNFITAAKDDFIEAHRIAQEHFDKHGPLLDPVMK